MFRGYRWQLIALIVALAVFTSAALFRISRLSQPQIAARTTPSSATQAVTVTNAPSPTPADNASISAPADSDKPRDILPASYREGLVGSVQRLNPLFVHLNPLDNDIASLIFEGLFATNDYGEAEPRLAAELVISSDGREYVLRLRDDISWQDGVPFSADDVVYTMSLLSDPDYAKLSPAARFWETVETQKLNDHLVRFRLAHPLGSFPYRLTVGILPEHALRGTSIAQLAEHPFNLSPIGTGPYQLEALNISAEGNINAVQLLLAPTFQRRPEAQGGYLLHDLRFSIFKETATAIAAFQSNQLDALANLAPREQLVALPDSKIHTQVDSSLSVLIFNWKEAAFTERRLRQALSLSLDAPALAQENLRSDATFADSPFAPGSSVYRPQQLWTNYDIEEARTMLEAADIFAKVDETDEATDSAPTPSFSLLILDSPPLRGLADGIAISWRQLGIDLEVEAVSAEELQNRLDTGRFEMAIVSQRLGADPDIYRYWHPGQYRNGANYGAASDNEIAELLEEARREIYSNRRLTQYHQFQEIFAEQAIAIPLYYPIYTFVVKNRIEGVQLGYLATAADRFRGIKDWRPATLAG